MNDFNRLVNEQMETMEKLLFLQAEIERCQQIENELKVLQQEVKLESIQQDINRMKKELRDIHHVFEKQTEELIQSYQSVGSSV